MSRLKLNWLNKIKNKLRRKIMKKIVLFLCVGILSAQGLLYAPFGKETLERQKRGIILTYLGKESCLKQRILDQEKEVTPILNFFLIQIFSPLDTEFDRNLLLKNQVTKEESLKIFWFYQKNRLYDPVYEYLWRKDDEKKDYSNVPSFYCSKIMTKLGYSLVDVFPDYRLISRALNETWTNKEELKKKLAEFDDNQKESFVNQE